MIGRHARESNPFICPSLFTPAGEGTIAARVYAVELMGDHSLVTCQSGDATLTVKADKAAAYEMDARSA